MVERATQEKPAVFFLAGHEVSARLFDLAADRLRDDFDCVGIDLPGFDGTSTAEGTTPHDLVSFVTRRIREHGSTRWLVAGQSGGAHVAAGVATRALEGGPGLVGLRGVVLIDAAPSLDAADFPTLAVANSVDVATALRRFWADWAGRAPLVSAEVSGAIASGRTSTRTRAIFARRALADDPAYVPRAMTQAQLTVLRAVADRAVPQTGPPVDLAARVDAGLALGASDGWRNAALPPDPVAYALALDDLKAFPLLSEGAQDDVLERIVAGDYSVEGGTLSAEQLNLWFEDCRVDLVRQWLGHPATFARIGFDGFANGGDLVRIQGFMRLGAGERDEWEPRLEGAR